MTQATSDDVLAHRQAGGNFEAATERERMHANFKRDVLPLELRVQMVMNEAKHLSQNMARQRWLAARPCDGAATTCMADTSAEQINELGYAMLTPVILSCALDQVSPHKCHCVFDPRQRRCLGASRGGRLETHSHRVGRYFHGDTPVSISGRCFDRIDFR
jgi:hypothetical protein